MRNKYLEFKVNHLHKLVHTPHLTTCKDGAEGCPNRRMTTCIKAKLKKSDDQTNIYKYDRVAANITE